MCGSVIKQLIVEFLPKASPLDQFSVQMASMSFYSNLSLRIGESISLLPPPVYTAP